MLFAGISVLLPGGKTMENAYVATQEDRIAWIGAARPSEDYGEVYPGKNRLLIPGLVNTHCHVPMTLMRGYGEGLPLQEWLNTRIFPFEKQLTPEDVYWGSMLGIAEMLQNGVTSFTDMYFLGPSIAKAAIQSGIRCNLSRGFTSTEDRPLAEQAEFQQAKELFENFHMEDHGRIRVDMGIHAEYTSTPESVRGVADYARKKDARIHLHLSETKREHAECLARRGFTPAAYFESLGVFENPVTAAHCVWVTDGDMEILARHGAFVSHNPTSNLKLGSGVAPVLRMREKGVPVALGTDGAASNNRYDVLSEMRLALLLQNGLGGNPAALLPADALQMASRTGALSQGRADTGEIAVGNKADLAVLSLDAPGMNPCYDTATHLAYSAQASDVVLTMCGGRVLYRSGQWATVDVERAKAQCAQTARRISLSLLGA